MYTKFTLLFALLSCLWVGCTPKQHILTDTSTVPPAAPDLPAEYAPDGRTGTFPIIPCKDTIQYDSPIRIYEAGDITLGSATALKGGVPWAASFRYTAFWYHDKESGRNWVEINLQNYYLDSHGHYLPRENMAFKVPMYVGRFPLKYDWYDYWTVSQWQAMGNYVILADDGCASNAAYRLDKTVGDNWVQIDSIDTENYRIKGKFQMSIAKLPEPDHPFSIPYPNRLKFCSGQFEGKLYPSPF